MELFKRREVSQFRRNGAPKIVEVKTQYGHASATVGLNSAPMVKWLVAQPIMVVVPIRAIRGVVESNQRVPISLDA